MNSICKPLLQCLSSVERVMTILTFGSMPYDRGSLKCAAWPRRDRTARGGGNKRRQENRAGWMEVLIRPTSRDIWLGQQKNELISKTNYIPFRFSFGTCPNQSQGSQGKPFKWAVGVFLLCVTHSCLPIFIYLQLTLGVQTHVGVVTSTLLPQIITFITLIGNWNCERLYVSWSGVSASHAKQTTFQICNAI